MKIIWSPLALERVQGIARYIAKDKPSAADKWVRRKPLIVEFIKFSAR